MSANLFAPGDMVRHRKGGEYVVIGRCTFEPTMIDCYAYRGEDGRMWVRPVEEMEDGRFKLVAREAGQIRRPDPPASDVKLCSVCGDPVRYGVRHYRCGSAVMEFEAEIARLRELLRGNSAVRALLRCEGEIERLRVDLDQQTLRATAEAEAAARLRDEVELLKALLRDWYETQESRSSARHSAAVLDTGRMLRGDERWRISAALGENQ